MLGTDTLSVEQKLPTNVTVALDRGVLDLFLLSLPLFRLADLVLTLTVDAAYKFGSLVALYRTLPRKTSRIPCLCATATACEHELGLVVNIKQGQ